MPILPNYLYLKDGRAIKRLVSLADPTTILSIERERQMLAVEDDDLIEFVYSSDREKRAIQSYQHLVKWCPSVVGLMQDPNNDNQLAIAYRGLKRGADCARGDDTSMLKTSVAVWLNERLPVPLFDVNRKEGRGFDHNATGRLLCPVDYDWFDANIRDALRNDQPQYPVNALRWPTFLYRDNQYNPAAPSNGLFMGELLVRAFRCIFTSPSSDVAGLLGMTSVQPRAIAYIAVQLRFALSNRIFWELNDNNFDYEIFYNNIIDWFEKPQSEAKTREIEDLLHWWNHMIFDHVPAIEPQLVEELSVALSMA